MHCVCNIGKALEVLEQSGVKLVNISADDIEEGNAKLTLVLIWSIIQHYYVGDVSLAALCLTSCSFCRSRSSEERFRKYAQITWKRHCSPGASLPRKGNVKSEKFGLVVL